MTISSCRRTAAIIPKRRSLQNVMDKRERRPVSKGFQRAATRIENERIRQNLYRSYNCIECSKAILVENVVTAKKFKVRDLSGTITHVVVYNIACREDQIAPYTDVSPNGNFQCKTGDDKCKHDCTTCAFSEPIMVGIGIPYKIARNARNAKGLTIRRIFYRCTNVQRMKHFDTGTVMSAYIRCEHYERGDDVSAKNGQSPQDVHQR